jgi:hypothetical protein
MPVVFEIEMDGSDGVFYDHFPLVGFYLDSAYNFKQSLTIEAEYGILLKNIISTILFSAMTLEAFINERAEDVIGKESRSDFDRCRGDYKKNKNESSVLFKFRKLVQIQFKQDIDSDLTEKIEYLIELRNTLVHYKLSDTAGKYYTAPAKKTLLPSGEYMQTIEFNTPIKLFDPPFLEKVSVDAGNRAFTNTLDCIKLWLMLASETEQLGHLSRFD